MSEVNPNAGKTCAVCGMPANADQGLHGATGNHWDCESKKFSDFEQASRRMDDAFRSMGVRPRRARTGTGRLARSITSMVLRAIQEHTKCEHIEAYSQWNQEGAYRGPRWDLACWGGSVLIDRIKRSYYCWTTMTACAKAGGIYVVFDERDGDFEIFPKKPHQPKNDEGEKLNES